MSVDPALLEAWRTLRASRPMVADGTVEEAREYLRAMTVGLRAAVQPVVAQPVVEAIDEVVPGPAGAIGVRRYRSDRAGPRPMIVFFHGGGFVAGDLDTHDCACRRLCRDVGADVVSVAYRLAPEHPYPAAIDDCYAAVRHIAARVDGEAPLVVAGDSGGANLASVCAQLARDDLGPRIAAQLLVYPPVDMPGTYPSRVENAEAYPLTFRDLRWFTHQYVRRDGPAATPLDDPRLSPLRGDLSDLPPAVIATAAYDPLRDEGNAYATALAAAGVDVRHREFATLTHGFYGLEDLSLAAAAATAWIHAELTELIDLAAPVTEADRTSGT